MYLYDDPYCRLIINLLTLFAHCPRHGYYGILATSLAVIIFAAGLFFQVATFFTHDIDMNLIAEIVPDIAALGYCLIYMPFAHMYGPMFDQLILLMENYAKEERSERENQVKQECDEIPRRIVKLIMIMIGIGASAVMLSPFFPNILDLIIPLNETRESVLLFHGEHFIDEHKYFYVILFFQCVAVCLVVTVVGSTECALVIFVCHACGIVNVIGYKLQNMSSDDFGDDKEDEILDEKKVINTITECVRLHREMLDVVEVIDQCTSLPFILMLICTVTAFSVTLIQVTDTQAADIKSVLFAACQIGQFLLVSVTGQILLNESMKFPEQIYSAPWYKCPPNLQKLFLILLLKSYKYCVLSTSSIYDVTIQNFGSVTRAAVSYFMVLRQFQ